MKILFISHEASLTGAPLVLLYFMEWLEEHYPNAYEVGVLHLKGGALEPRFNKLAKHVFKMAPNRPSITYRVANKIAPEQLSKKLKTPNEKMVNQIAELGFDIIYANTAVALNTATEIKQKTNNNTKLIAHIHELYVGLKRYVKDPDKIVPHLDKIIAVSQVVRNNILQEWKLESTMVDVVYEFSKTNVIQRSSINKDKVFTVGASGTVFWRKGPDLFIQVARYIKENHPKKKLQFVWVGKISESEQLILGEDLIKLDLKDSVHFVGQQENPHPYFENFDVFLMTSREDPFPLVCIEVGMLGKPIVCFDKATGIQEVIAHGGGKVVPYLNIEKMSQAVVDYYDDKTLLEKDACIAKEKFSQFTPEIRCPQIYEIIKNIKYI